MIPQLPNELKEIILRYLHSDRVTLLSCALVGRAWVSASQRGIFKVIVLDLPNTHFKEFIDAYVIANARLIASFESNPRLATYVRSLKLRNRCSTGTQYSDPEVVASTVRIVQRLSNVIHLSLSHLDWDSLSPSLQEALCNVFKTPSLTRIALNHFHIRMFAETATMLSHTTNLKVLKISPVFCNNWTLPESFMTTSPLLRLDKLRLDYVNSPIASWIQRKIAPNLRSLELSSGSLMDFEVLRHFSRNLEKLEIDDVHPKLFSHIPTPNLKALKIFLLIEQNDSETPVPYIQSVFEYLLNMDGMRCSQLRYMSLHLDIEHNNLLDTPQWGHWAALNAQLERLELASLQVNITVASCQFIPDGVIEKLEGKLSFLKELGNLFVELDQMS